MMCAEKTRGFNLVNYTYSSGVYHEQETQDVYGRMNRTVFVGDQLSLR